MNKIKHKYFQGTIGNQILFAWISLFFQSLITVTGTVVRVSSSGLGCETWPKCHANSFIPNSKSDQNIINQLIEFGNRTLTFFVIIFAFFLLINVFKGKRTILIKSLIMSVLFLTFVQGIIGGITVRLGLRWWIVSLHMLISLLIICISTILVARIYENDKTQTKLRIPRIFYSLIIIISFVLFASLLSGTLVTATGPHSGDKNITTRLNIELEKTAMLHSKFLFIYIGLLVGLIFGLISLKIFDKFKFELVGVSILIIIEGIVGYTQYFNEVPPVLVVFHILIAVNLLILTSLIFAKAKHKTYIAENKIFRN